MSNCPPELSYAETHEWIGEDQTGAFKVGISDFAQSSLGDVVYVELPEQGLSIDAGEEVCVIESVKAASDIYCPIAGMIVGVNLAIEEDPGLVNEDPYGKGWIFKIAPVDVRDLDTLMDALEYTEHCESDSDEDASGH